MAVSRIDIEPLKPYFESGSTILVPTLRIKDAILSQYHDDKGGGIYRSPLVVPIDVWIKETWELLGASGITPFSQWQLLSANEERFVWASITQASQATTPLLNSEETAQQISQSYQDSQQWGIWQTLIDESSHYRSNPDVSAFIDWTNSFREHCNQKQLISLVDSIRLLSEKIPKQAIPLLPQSIALSNFDQPPPLYQSLFSTLASVSRVDYVSSSEKTSTCTVTRREFTESATELEQCALWAHQQCQNNKNAHIGILVANSTNEKSAIERQFDNVFRSQRVINLGQTEPLFNASSNNRPLTESALIRDALTLLGLFWGEQSSNDVCKLLQSNYLDGAQTERPARIAAELVMRKKFGANCALFELSSLLDSAKSPSYSPVLASALLKAKTVVREHKAYGNPRHWVKLFNSLLDCLGWPSEVLSTEQQREQQSWQDSLESFAKFGKSLGRLDALSALSKLKMLLDNVSLGTGFSSRRQLSLYTMTEAQGLHFDHVWLLAFDDQCWPPAASPSAFLPYDLQRTHQLPGAHGETQFTMASETLDSLFNNVSGSVVASHHCTEGDQQLRVSSLLSHIDCEPVPSNASWPLSHYGQSIFNANEVTSQIDEAPPVLSDLEKIRGGQSVLSNQSSCPFRAFAKHRLKTESLDEFSSGLNSLARGVALHTALESFYKGLIDSAQLANLTADDLEPRLAKAVAEAIDYLSSNYKKLMTPRFSAIEQQRMTALLMRFIDVDNNREDFSFVDQEKSYSFEKDNLRLSLKIDRIDSLNDGSLALIDYKTGKSAPSRDSWLKERPEDVQLPLYFVAAQSIETEPVTALAIAHVNAEKMAYSGLCANNNFDTELKAINEDEKITQTWADLSELWDQRIHSLATDFSAGSSSVDPVNSLKTCTYCGLQSLCRISESMLDDDGYSNEHDESDLVRPGSDIGDEL